jgi:uncharacterized protein YdaU (DUF1376 family)
MGNKDPAVLWYTGDFLIGTSFMTNEQVGMYARLLAHQHQNGHLSEEQMMQICKTYDKDVFLKFVQDDDGLYYNERMDEEVNKRRKYSESRRMNRLSKKDEKDMSDICQSHDEHMENENENINKDISNTVIKKDKVIRHKYGSYENVLLSDEDYEKLVSEFPSDYKKRIEQLSEGIASKGYKYKNHLATIRSWARREKEKPSGNPFKDKLKEMIQDEQSRDNSPHVGYQGGLSKLLQEPDGD